MAPFRRSLAYRARMNRRPAAALVTVLLAMNVVAGCSVVDGIRGEGSAPSVSVSPQPPPPGSEALARFYAQRLEWRKCEGAQCASLEVPVDYENPQGQTIELAVVKVPREARVEADRFTRRQPGRTRRVRRRLRPGGRLHRHEGGAAGL